MLKAVTKYGLAAHLALLAVAPLFLSPAPLLWLSLLAFVWLLMEPSRIGSEMLHDARRRVWSGLLRDPVFWVLTVLVVIAALRALNTGIGMAYDAEAMKWTLSSPNMPILPGSVDGVGGMHFATAVVALVVLSGCRHALGKKARVVFVSVAGLIVASELLIRLYFVDRNMAELSKIAACPQTTPLYVGVAYGVLCLLSLPNLAAIFENRWRLLLLAQGFAICGLSVGLFVYAPPAVIALFACVGAVLMAYTFLYLRIKVSKTADFKYLVVAGVAFVLAAMVVMSSLSPDALAAKTAPFLSGNFLEDSFWETRRAISAVCLRIWKQLPWLGTGLGSFMQALGFHAEALDWSKISPLQSAPLNGYWLLLVERGVLGAFALAVPLVLLVLTWVFRLIGAQRALPHPLCLLAPLMMILAAVESLIDGSFLLTEVLVPFAVVFSISASSFVKERRKDVE